MTETAGNRVLLCDDDALVRSVVRRVLEDAGYEVVAEADSPDTASATMQRAPSIVLVLDLALRSGHGEHVLTETPRGHAIHQVIVFSAYVSDPADLLDRGAHRRHREARLRPARRGRAASSLSPTGSSDARPPPATSPTPHRPAPADRHHLSGLEPWRSFQAALAAVSPFDFVRGLRPAPERRPP